MKSIWNYNLPKDKPWLILGKGPTFDNFYKYNLEDYHILCLNHTAEIIQCNIAHFIDSECISLTLIENSNIICCPVYPHKWNRATGLAAKQYFHQYQNHNLILEKLYCYNCSTYKFKPHSLYGEIVKAKYFSSEAAFRLLGMMGIRKIYSLGIDGGQNYASHFSHLKPLTNKRKTFDDQFKELEKITQKWEIEWVRL